MKQLKTGISLVINTRNEEQNIDACIDSAKGLVSEIIVVDMESTDKTIALAKKWGARVFSHPNIGYVEPARQFALEKARHEWTLLMDADERLPLSLSKKFEQLKHRQNLFAVKTPHKNLFFGIWLQHTGWWPDYHFRFFRTGAITWPEGIHAKPLVTGPTLTLPAKPEYAFIHHNADDISSFLEKVNRYTSHEGGWQKPPISIAAALKPSEKEFTFRFFTHAGYKDGTAGLVLSKIMEFYRFLEFAKYWEKSAYPEWFTSLELRQGLKTNTTAQLEEELREIKDSAFYRLGWAPYVWLRKLFSFLARRSSDA